MVAVRSSDAAFWEGTGLGRAVAAAAGAAPPERASVPAVGDSFARGALAGFRFRGAPGFGGCPAVRPRAAFCGVAAFTSCPGVAVSGVAADVSCVAADVSGVAADFCGLVASE